MKRKIILDIIAANRDYLMQNSKMALDNLTMLHKDFDSSADEACILSLALNDSIAAMIFYADYDRSIAISQKVLDRFPNSSNDYLVARHLSAIGRCMALSGRHEEAHQYLSRALDLAQKANEPSLEDIKMSVDILHDQAMNNDRSGGNPKKTILYLGKALTLMNDTPLEVRKGICLMGLGNVKYGEEKYRAALRYYIKASKIFEDQYNLPNLASAHCNMGLCYTELGQMDLAERSLNQSLDLRMRTGNNDEIAISYINLAQLFDRMKDTEKTYANLMACRNYSMKGINRKLYIDTLLWLESISMSRNDTAAAMAFRKERQKEK